MSKYRYRQRTAAVCVVHGVTVRGWDGRVSQQRHQIIWQGRVVTYIGNQRMGRLGGTELPSNRGSTELPSTVKSFGFTYSMPQPCAETQHLVSSGIFQAYCNAEITSRLQQTAWRTRYYYRNYVFRSKTHRCAPKYFPAQTVHARSSGFAAYSKHDSTSNTNAYVRGLHTARQRNSIGQNRALTNVCVTGCWVHCHRLWNSMGVVPDCAQTSASTLAKQKKQASATSNAHRAFSPLWLIAQGSL